VSDVDAAGGGRDTRLLDPVPEDFIAALYAAHNGTGTWELFDLDEAELRAAGLPPIGRVQAPNWVGNELPLDHPALIEAGRRLVERGLAEPRSWAYGPVRPIGTLLGYWHLLFHPKAVKGLVAGWSDPPTPAAVHGLRLTLLAGVMNAGSALVERSVASDLDPALPRPIRVQVRRWDVLIDEISAIAFTAHGGSTITTASFVEPGRGEVSTVLTVGPGAPIGSLAQPRAGRLGPRTRVSPVSPDEYADHLQGRLITAV
jgi:hypothetical protein